MLIHEVREKISSFLKSEYNIKDPDFQVMSARSLEDGDFFTNAALKYSGQVNKNPMDIAEEIKLYLYEVKTNTHLNPPVEGGLTSSPLNGGTEGGVSLLNFVDVKIKQPGFLNFFYKPKYFQKLIHEILEKEQDYGKMLSSTSGAGIDADRALVEYSSPNIAKPFTIGHLRSTIIGDAVANLLEFSGVEVIRDNHLGDWGTQYGKLAYAVKTWGDEKQIENSDNPIKELVDLYVKFHEEAEKNPEIEEKGRKWFKKLEEGDEEVRKFWEKCVNWSLNRFKKYYELLGVRFDTMLGESFFEDKMDSVIEELKEKKLIKKDKGAWLAYFEDLPPLMIIKKDGTTLYATRDLAADKYRKEKYGDDILIINEVGGEQDLYFRQVFKLEEKLGWFKPHQRVHVKHGLYRFKDVKMSTRKGNVIWLEDVLNEAVKRAEDLASDSENVDKAKVSHQVGVGALKWNDLKREAHKDVVFDWDEVLNMDGNSGPYVQYTHARARSVLANSKSEKINPKQISNIKYQISELNNNEKTLLRLLAKFPEEVERAVAELSPHYICHYLFDLCQTYNTFYASNKIIGSENEETRLLLTKSTAQVVKNGLALLGIEAPEEM